MPIVSIWRVPEKSSLSTLLPLINRLERARRGPWKGIPPFGEGKHRARLYAAHSFGALPRTRHKNGVPTESKFRGERRNSETNELCRKRQQREMWSL